MRILTKAGLLLGALATTAASAAEPSRCVTHDEVAALALALAPGFLDQSRTQCASLLPSSAHLRLPASQAQMARLENEAAANKGASMKAILAVAGVDKMPDGVGPDMMLGMVSELIVAQAMTKLDAQKCNGLNTMFKAMEPMTGMQAGLLFAGIAGIATAGKKNQKMPIC